MTKAATLFEATAAALLSMILVIASGSAFAANESILSNFGPHPDGNNPASGLISDASGNLFGTTVAGGTNFAGTVFELLPPTTSGGNWIRSTLWNFAKNPDGQSPFAGLIMDPNGNLYGTTDVGGLYDSGIVFELSPPATSGGGWTETILWNFNPASGDGRIRAAP